jgi:hypothetical protein
VGVIVIAAITVAVARVVSVVVRTAGVMRDAVPVRMLRAAREDRPIELFLRVKEAPVEVAVIFAVHPVVIGVMDRVEISAGAMIAVMTEARDPMALQHQSGA